MTASTRSDGGQFAAPPRLLVWFLAGSAMLLPILAMRGVDPAAWDPPGDFIFLFVLLAGSAGANELVTCVPARLAYRVAVALGVTAIFLHAWVNLAVGIIGSEDNPANLIYVAVIAVAALGSLLARFRAPAMARVMTAAAICQAAVFFIAWATGLGFTGPITVFFVALWLASAALFRRSAAP